MAGPTLCSYSSSVGRITRDAFAFLSNAARKKPSAVSHPQLLKPRRIHRFKYDAPFAKLAPANLIPRLEELDVADQFVTSALGQQD